MVVVFLFRCLIILFFVLKGMILLLYLFGLFFSLVSGLLLLLCESYLYLIWLLGVGGIW